MEITGRTLARDCAQTPVILSSASGGILGAFVLTTANRMAGNSLA